MIAYPIDSHVSFSEDGIPEYDRAVTSETLRKLLRSLFNTGIDPTVSTNLQVAADEGMNVIVRPGFAMVDGCMALEPDTRVLAVQAASTEYDRIDTVVLRLNDNDAIRECDLYVVKGLPSSTPVHPDLTRSGAIYEIGLADIFVGKNSSRILASKITDTRFDMSRCGVMSAIAEFDSTTIYEQVQQDLAEFKSNEEQAFQQWYEGIVNILDVNAAGHLQNEIDALQPVRKRTITNLLDPSLYIITSKITQNGITITNNGDGTFTVNGTTDSNVGTDGRIAVNITQWAANTIIATGYSKLKLCGTPSSINQTGMLQIADLNTNSGNATTWASDKGNGFVFNTVDDKVTTFSLRFEFLPNTTFDNVVFKPMLTADLNATYDDYVEYSGDGELNENVADIVKQLTTTNTNLNNKVKLNGTAVNSINFELSGTTLTITTS